jgi:hypothetical protein
VLLVEAALFGANFILAVIVDKEVRAIILAASNPRRKRNTTSYVLPNPSRVIGEERHRVRPGIKVTHAFAQQIRISCNTNRRSTLDLIQVVFAEEAWVADAGIRMFWVEVIWCEAATIDVTNPADAFALDNLGR